MRYLDILKKPFKYDDIESMNIVESLITLGISLAIFVLNNTIGVKIIVNKLSNGIASSMGGSSFLKSQLPYSIFAIGSLGEKATFRIFYSSLIGFLVAVAAVILIIFVIRKAKDKDYTLIKATSFIAASLVLPVVITPLILIGIILFNQLGVYIAMFILMASMIIMLINIVEGFNVTNSLGKGNSIYFTSIITAVYYSVSTYVTVRVFVSALLRAIKNFY